jgi:Fe2+ or Zn2+ uptake regulation protein
MPQETRCGVRLTPLKARIFDLVNRAGEGGISADDIGGIIGAANPNTLKAHVYQLNEALAESGVEIRSVLGCYLLKETHEPR